MQVKVETERLILRELDLSDDLNIFELDADPDVHQFLGNKPIETIEQARQTVDFIRQQYQTHGIGRWAVIEKATKAFLGWAGLKLITVPINNKTGFYDLGYRFIRKYWGMGYATEAAIASLHYGFEQLALTEIYGMAHINNISSQKVLQNVGLKYIETFDFEGAPHYWYKILGKDWAK
jgi:RimJ/RimL family protein N-acetyltransferase